MTSHVRVTDLGELLAVIPYRLGFHPLRSLVCVTLIGGRLGPIQRVDLPDEPDRPLAFDDAAWGPGGPAGDPVLLLAWEDTPGESLGALAEAARRCESRGVDVLDVVLVRGGRWWSLADGRPRLGPGFALPPAADVPAVAEFVGRGVHPAGSRAELEARLCAVQDDAAAVEECLRRRRRRRTEVATRREREGVAAWARILTGASRCGVRVDGVDGVDGSGPGVDAVAAAIDVLDDSDVRDALAACLAPGVVPDEVLDRRVCARLDDAFAVARAAQADSGDPGALPAEVGARLARLVGSVPEHERAGVLALYGLHAWWRGDGAVAEIAARRAHRADPRHTLAGLVSDLVHSALRPDEAGRRAAPLRAEPGTRSVG